MSSSSASFCLRKGTPATSGVGPSTLFRLLHLNFTTLGSSSLEPLHQGSNTSTQQVEKLNLRPLEKPEGGHGLHAYVFGSLTAPSTALEKVLSQFDTRWGQV